MDKQQDPSNAAAELVAATAESVSRVPGTAAFVQWLARGLGNEMSSWTSTALRIAQEESGLSLEDLRERMEENPRLERLLTRVMFAAGMSGHDRTLKAMCGAFARAATDPQQVDEVELLLQALVDLTEDHVRVMLILREAAPRENNTGHAWYLHALKAGSPLLTSSTEVCLRQLLARGLAGDISSGAMFGSSQSSYRLSEVGETVLELLHRYADA